MNILFVVDYHMPSGYRTLSEGIIKPIAENHNVWIIANGYTGEEHYEKYRLIPSAPIPQLPYQIFAIAQSMIADWVIFIKDIDRSNYLNDCISRIDDNFHDKYNVGAIFPVESDPFPSKWADEIKKYYCLVATFTTFGVTVLNKANVTSIKLPVGLPSFWYEDTKEPPIINEPYVLSVADNQERKNIPLALDIFSDFLKIKPNYKFILCTDKEKRSGWDLQELLVRKNLQNSVIIYSPNLVTNNILKNFYTYASAFLLVSLAEGIGLPFYEAQSQGCPCVGTNCCGIAEALHNSDFLVDVDRITTYEWGNINHYWASKASGVEKLILAVNYKQREKVVYNTWTAASNRLIDYMQEFCKLQEGMRA